MKIFPSGIAAQGSFKRQIILLFVVGFFFLAAAFTAYQMNTERAYLYRGSTDETISLAESLAASSRSWVLAYDLNGMQEVVHSFQSHPELRYAMIISPSGKVLAHTDTTKIGQFVSDESSLALIKSPPVNRIMVDDESLSDIAVPIMMEQRHIGWARLAQGREGIADNLHKMMLSSALFVLMAVVLSLFAARLIANRLGYRIGYLMRVAEEVQAGNYAIRANISGGDEIARLANSLNHMLDVLAREEVQLRKSESRYRLLVESSPMCIHEIGMDGRISSMNRAGLAMMGVEEECKVQGFLYLDAVCDTDRERIGELLARAYAGEASNFEFKASGPGELIFKSCFVPIKNQNGNVEKLMGITEDITERNLAETALREQTNFLNAIFESLLDAFVLIDSSGVIVDWSRQAEKIFGWGKEEAVGRALHETIIPSRYREAHNRGMEHFLASGEAALLNLRTEIFALHHDGHEFPVELFIVPLKKGDSYEFSGFVRDITDRKRAEEALRESEDKFKYVFDHSPIGKTLTFPSGELQVNHAFCELLGYSEKELGHSRWQDITHPDDIESTQRTIDQLLSEERDSARFVKRYIHKSGSVVWADVVTSLRRDEEGKPLYFMTSILDITERKRAEEELRKYHEHLEELVLERTSKLEDANKELEAFSYSVSHDLRSPLRAIDGFSHILLDDYTGKLDEEGKRLLNVVRDNTSRMGQLIDDILKFSRTSRLEMTSAEIDMEGLAHEVVEELRPADGKLQVEIEPIPPSMGDRAMMHQVFVNLLSNAIKFSRSKEVSMIKVGGSIKGDEAVYYVKDNGAGFDMHYADRLFGVFQRLHGMDEFEGTGIGLAIVKRIVTRHGGRVWAEGKVNEGATIYFALPTKATAQA